MAGRIQGADVKSEAELVTAGTDKTALIHDSKIYVTGNSINKTLDQAIIDSDIGGGGGGGGDFGRINWLSGDDHNFEGGIGNWVLYNDGASATPVNGIGGTPAGVTLVHETGSPIRGTGSLKFTKDSSNRQGMGFSLDLPTIDLSDNLVQTCYLELNYSTTALYSDGNVVVYMYNVDSSTLITVDPVNGIDKGTGTFYGSFESDSSSNDYRLILHNSNAGGSAWDVVIDRVAVGPAPSPVFHNDEIFLRSGNGHGSTNNKIRRYSTVQTNTGTSMSLSQSGTLGDIVTINKGGVYHVNMTDRNNSTFGQFGISLNSTQLTTAIDAISGSDRLIYTENGIESGSGTHQACSVTLYLAEGDVVRPHTNGALNNADARTQFSIRRIV